MITVNGRTATHYCNQCGALWLLYGPMQGAPEGGWSLVSRACGPCCDNAPMGAQIVPIRIEPEDLT